MQRRRFGIRPMTKNRLSVWSVRRSLKCKAQALLGLGLAWTLVLTMVEVPWSASAQTQKAKTAPPKTSEPSDANANTVDEFNGTEDGGMASEPRLPFEARVVPRKKARWMPPPGKEETKKVNANSSDAPRVRIGLRLTPFKKLVNKGREGAGEVRFIPAEPLRHTLRARLNKTNHFFVGEWHIETRPTLWIAKTRRYEVELHVFRRYGAFGQLEENIGVVPLSGVLDEQEDKLFVLLGVARKRLRDRFNNPYLDVVAGFGPQEARPEVAKGPSYTTIPEPPGQHTNAILKGRF